MKRTSIEWTDFSANPLKYRDADGKVVWACVHASPGCENCYSEQLAHRYNRGGRFNVPTMAKLTPFLDEKEMRAMLRCAEASGKRCFPFDMTDLFGEWVSDDLLNQVFSKVLEQRRDVTWQLLTKRSKRAKEYLSWRWGGRLVPRHIWIGVSVEDRDRLWRIDDLKDTPAAVHFVSFEPLLEDVGAILLDGIQWGIVGGESGSGARPHALAWARSIVRQFQAAGLPVFFKQAGAVPLVPAGRQTHWDYRFVKRPEDKRFVEHDGEHWRMRLLDKKGGDISELPEWARVREFPEVRA